MDVKQIKTAKVKLKGIKVTKTKVRLAKGEKIDLGAVPNPITSPDKLKFKSADKKIATVSSSGVVKGKKKGKTKITVTCGKKRKVVTVIVE